MCASAIAEHADRARVQCLHDAAVALGADCGCSRRGEIGKQGANRLQRYNPNHYGPGERGGQFAPSGEGNAGASTDAGRPKPVQVASNDTGAMTDAGAQKPEQVAAGDESDDEGGRGRGPIEDEFDPTAPIRQEFYNAARAKLRAIDPTNPAIPSISSPDWIPSKEDDNDMQEALDRAIENQAASAAEHGYQNHIEEFRDIHSQIELQLRAQDVIRKSKPEIARDGRVFFYQSSTNTLVIVNTASPEDSTVFRPEDGRAFVDRNLKDK
jgi:hypothetical protein